eukprot:gene13652-13435_t
MDLAERNDEPVPGRRVFAPRGATLVERPDGTKLLTSDTPLGVYERHLCEYLRYWAQEAPDRTFVAERHRSGAWARLTYEEAWRRAAAIGQGLTARGLGPGDAVALLSGNSIAHALVTFGAMMAGVAAAPISPSYSLIPEGLQRLAQVIEVLAPAVVFVEEPSAFPGARQLPGLTGALWFSTEGGAGTLPLKDLESEAAGPALWSAYQAQTPDTIAKILFTSGSTGAPKGVLNSQRMLCSAIRGAADLLPRNERPPVLVDWLPWHHTMGGNANLHGVLRDGGSLYIDDGRPTPEAFHRTLRNLKELSPTSVLNVPAGWQLLVQALHADADLREAFFKNMTMMASAGASLPADTWRAIKALARESTGEEIAFAGSYGTTETGPGISTTHWVGAGLGEIGSPIPGVIVKLVPAGDRYEVRVRGPNVTPGYLRRPDLTAAAFDEEGFYRVGDAATFVDPKDPSAGLRFAGRLSENFKLTNGAWVVTGDLRLAILDAAGPILRDVVVAGHDRDDVRLLVWADSAGLGEAPDLCDPAAYRRVAEAVRERLRGYNQTHRAQTHRVAAFRILREPASL